MGVEESRPRSQKSGGVRKCGKALVLDQLSGKLLEQGVVQIPSAERFLDLRVERVSGAQLDSPTPVVADRAWRTRSLLHRPDGSVAHYGAAAMALCKHSATQMPAPRWASSGRAGNSVPHFRCKWPQFLGLSVT